VIGLSVIAAVIYFVQRPNWFNGWMLFVLALAILAVKARSFALNLQDRII